MNLDAYVLDHNVATAAGILFLVFFIRAVLFAGGSQIWTRYFEWPKHRKVVLPEQERTNWIRDFRRGILIILFDASVFGTLFNLGAFKINRSPTPIAILVTFVLYFLWYEIYFYFSHRALHHPKLFWIHSRHHEGRGTTPWTSLSFSFSERVTLHFGAFVPAILSQWFPLPLPGIGLYFLTNYILNVYGHMNVEIVTRSLAGRLFASSVNTCTSHTLHHLRFRGNYSLFLPLLDRWLGTDFEDYPQVLENVQAGRGALAGLEQNA